METVVEGLRSVIAAFESGAEVVDLFTTSEFSPRAELLKWSAKLGDSHHELSDQEFQDLSGVESAPGVLATVGIPDPVSINALKGKRILLLDAVQDPGNLGTIIRSAAWFGFRQILLSEGCVDHFAPKVIRASMGGSWELDFISRLNLESSLTTLKEMNYQIFAADMNGAIPEESKPEKLVLILGNEASGLSNIARTMADELVAIPRFGDGSNPESLNVSSAAAILMSQLAPT